MIPAWGSVLWAILGYVLFASAVVLVHEWGHFWVGRRMGLRIERFSLGLGKPLWRKPSPTAGEWVLSALPLGGYVKFPLAPEDCDALQRRQYLNTAPWSVRLAVYLAGPAANFLLAAVLLVGYQAVDRHVPPPVLFLPPEGSVLEAAGVKGGERVLSVDGRVVRGFDELQDQAIRQILHQAPMTWVIQQGSAVRSINVLPPDLARGQGDGAQDLGLIRDLLVRQLGLTPFNVLIPPVVRAVREPPEENPLRPGDEIRAVDGQPTPTIQALSDAMKGTAGRRIDVDVIRQGQARTLSLTPAADPRAIQDPKRRDVGLLGVQLERSAGMRHQREFRPLGWETVTIAVQRTADTVATSFVGMYRLARLQIGPELLSGPAQIADVSGTAIRSAGADLARHIAPSPRPQDQDPDLDSVAYALLVLALLNIGIGAFNLLPLPVLDGGGALLALWVGATRREVPERTLKTLQVAGMAGIGLLVAVGLYSDWLAFGPGGS